MLVTASIHAILSSLKKTFFIVVGSDMIILMTIESKMTEKLTVKAADLLPMIVVKKKHMTMKALVVRKKTRNQIQYGALMKTSN